MSRPTTEVTVSDVSAIDASAQALSMMENALRGSEDVLRRCIPYPRLPQKRRKLSTDRSKVLSGGAVVIPREGNRDWRQCRTSSKLDPAKEMSDREPTDRLVLVWLLERRNVSFDNVNVLLAGPGH